MSSHQIVWRNAVGEIQGIIQDYQSLDYAFGEMVVGAATIVLPASVYGFGTIGKDHILEIQRRTTGGKFKAVGERAWFVRGRKQDAKVLTLKAYDPVYLLTGRIVAYAADTSYSKKSAAAANVLKAIVRENLGSSATDTARPITNFSVQADDNNGATVSAAFSRNIVLDTLKKIAGASSQAGTYISFDVVYQFGTAFEFRTYKNQRGKDRGLSTVERMTFSEKNKNLVNTEIEEDQKDEVTYEYAGGSGEGSARAIGTASSSKVGETIWSRRERFWDGKNTADPTTLNNDAAAELYANRARKFITGEVQETEFSRFDVDYGYGDIVVIEGFGIQADARISTVHIQEDPGGKETIDIKLRGEW